MVQKVRIEVCYQVKKGSVRNFVVRHEVAFMIVSSVVVGIPADRYSVPSGPVQMFHKAGESHTLQSWLKINSNLARPLSYAI